MSAPKEPQRYEFPRGLHWSKAYPVEGDCAFAELWYGDTVWADITLHGVTLDAVGPARVEEAVVGVRVFEHPQRRWEFELTELQDVLEAARQWLLANETARLPLAEEDASSTAASSALSKMSNPEEFLGNA